MEETLTVIDGKFTHVCSGCKRKREVKFTKKMGRVRLKCNCGYMNIIPLNYRRHERKKTNVNASLHIGDWVGAINIIDMSIYGYRFTLIDDPPKPLCVCDTVKISYQLDDTKKSNISDIVEIKTILNNNKHGVEIVDPEDYGTQQKNKGFWLMYLDE